jgi:hypothetical protein
MVVHMHMCKHTAQLCVAVHGRSVCAVDEVFVLLINACCTPCSMHCSVAGVSCSVAACVPPCNILLLLHTVCITCCASAGYLYACVLSWCGVFGQDWLGHVTLHSNLAHPMSLPPLSRLTLSSMYHVQAGACTVLTPSLAHTALPALRFSLSVSAVLPLQASC